MSLMSFDALEAIREALAGAGGAKTCDIGFEDDISPNDYPIIRIVPYASKTSVGFYGETVECAIFFGNAIDQSTRDENNEPIRLRGVYKSQLAMRDEIIKRLQFEGGPSIHYKGTVFDGDRIAGFKLQSLLVDLGF